MLGAPGAYRWQGTATTRHLLLVVAFAMVHSCLGITQFVQKLHHDALFVDSTEQNEGADEFAYMGCGSIISLHISGKCFTVSLFIRLFQ